MTRVIKMLHNNAMIANRKTYWTQSSFVADAPWVICLHGIPTSGHLYHHVQQYLNGQFNVVAVDLPGFGQSDKNLEWRYHFSEYIVWLDQFIDHLACSKVHLVVHDYGGPIGLGWATHYPEKIASLMILNTTIFIEHFRPPLVAVLGLTPVLGRLAIQHGMREKLFSQQLSKEFVSISDADLAKFVLNYSNEQSRKVLAKIFRQYAFSLPFLYQVRKSLYKLSMPVTILFGKHDPYCRVSNAYAFARQIPHAQLLIAENAKHFVAIDEPLLVANTLQAQIKQCVA
jgi:pimeloyl-ACP methyl ester carboxylesterase